VVLDRKNLLENPYKAAIYYSDITRALGSSKFPSDIYSDDCLFGVVVRSPFAHALLKRVDVSEALNVPGVETIVLAEDIPGKKFFGKIIDDTPVLVQPNKKIHSTLDALCLIAASNEDCARQAATMVRIEAEELDAIYTIEEALKPGSVVIHDGGNIAAEIKIKHGDILQGFEDADVIVENTYHVPSIDHAFLETEAAFAEPIKDGIRVFVGSQNPYLERSLTSEVLSLPVDKIEIIDVHAGGGFGGKDDSLVTLFASLLAWKSKKPVRMVWSRQESLRGHSKRHPMIIKARTGATKDGKLTAMQIEVKADTGSYAHWGPAILKFTSLGANGVYEIPNTWVDTKVVYTNNIMSGAMRAWGNQAIAFVVERQIDQLAHRLNIHPLRFRWLNAITDDSLMIYGTKPPPRVGARATIEAAANYLNLNLEDARPIYRDGLGFASVMQGVNYHFGHVDASEVRVGVGWDNVFEIYAATSDIGQGLEAELRLIFSKAIGDLPIEKIRWMPQSTSTSPNAGSTGASRHTCTTANAVWGAARLLRQKLIAIAAEILNEPPTNILIAGEKLGANGVDIPLAEVLDAARQMNINLTSKFRFVASPTTDIDENGQGFPINQYTYETLISRVEVSGDTGQVKVLEMNAFVDAGRIVNPIGASKQVEGGCVMGLGYALTEEFKSRNGMPLSDSFSTYLIPTALDAPEEIGSFFIDEPINFGEVGGRGLAEVVVVAPAPSIVNAIVNLTDANLTRLPATPERVLMSIELANQGSIQKGE